MILVALALALSNLSCAVSTHQTPRQVADSLKLGVAQSVDTTNGPGKDILVLWRAYLTNRPDSVRSNARWSRVEQTEWPRFDLAGQALYPTRDWWRGAAVTVVELAPAIPKETTVYVIRTLFVQHRNTSDTLNSMISSAMLARVYAVREDGHWVLANALPRVTTEWTHTRVGRITFIYPAARHFDSLGAIRSARFVDSAAAAVGLALPKRISYYLAGTPREAARIVGLDLVPATGGRLYAEDAITIGGLPGATEWYPHDLAHIVLAPITAGTPRFLNEGAATWLGGARGRGFSTLVKELQIALEHGPSLSLSTIIAPHTWTDTVSNTAAAVLVRMAFEHRGAAGVRQLLAPTSGTPDAIRRSAASAIGIPLDSVDARWRASVRKIMRSGT